MNPKSLTIGKVAKQAGVGVETIRFYQREGLITEPAKPDTGFRVYPPETIAKLKFINRAKELGFTLSEIAVLLELDSSECSRTKQIAARKLELINNKIRDLKSMSHALESLVDACDSNDTRNSCPIISSLSAWPTSP